MPSVRRLAAILAADVVGYSRLMGQDEAGTARVLREHRVAADPLVAEYGGRIVKTTGDGVLIEFASVVGAVECALALQKLAVERNADIPSERRMEWRTGIHLGDVLVEGDDILGDGVNIAARLEGIAQPGGICISEDAYRQVLGKIEAAFTDIGEQSLKNIARRLRVYRAGPASASERPTTPATALPLPDKPSIAVLPFANLSGDPEQEYFADGMVEEIITALSRIRWLFVIARNSSFTYKGQAVDVKRVGRELGVHYVLEGSVRKAGGRVRITAQLIDASTGGHLWADRFDGSLEDVFDLQDKVGTSVAGVIEPALQAAETGRSAHRPTNDLTAYDLYLRGYAMILSSTQQAAEALRLMEQAIERDPHYGPALAGAAVCCYRFCHDGSTKNPDADARKGANFARRALQEAGDDPGILANGAVALAYFGADIDATMALVEHALTLNPSFARGWYISGVLRAWAGEPDLAIERYETALRLSPRGRIGWVVAGIGIAHFLSRRYDQAIPKLLFGIQQDPEHSAAYRHLAACYVHLERFEEARETIERLRVIVPRLTPSIIPYRNPEHRELYLSGLRLAAGEER
jgi:adenylate cyclase